MEGDKTIMIHSAYTECHGERGEEQREGKGKRCKRTIL